jgi:hypothetical protein
MADQQTLTPNETKTAHRRNSRRGFLRTAGGVAAGSALFIAGCDSDGGGLPENQNPTANSLTVGGREDNAQDDLTVTFTPDFGDTDVGGGEIEDDVSARIELSNGDVINDVASGETVSYTFDQRGQYTATLIVEDNFGGRDRVRETFMVGAMEVTLDFSNDFGVLNYAYALEQLEAAFYAQVVANLDSGDLTFSGVAGSRAGSSFVHGEYFRDVAAHENIHRDFLAAAIPALGGEAIPSLVPNFSSVDFTDGDSVLATAQVLEDTGVSAYNGAADLIDDPTLLTIAGKIVSVEARHASAIRDLIGPADNFADLDDLTDFGAVPADALDVLQSPQEVLAAADGFITTPISATGL